jgi:hypothetical protein
MKKRKRIALLACAVAAFAGDNDSGFKTEQPAMLSPVMAGVQIDPLLTVGDVLPSGYRFESIPDGISLRTRGQGRVDLFVNHETSKVPFPYNTATPTAANGQSDFDNAQVSRLILNQHSAGVLNGSFVIRSSGGFQRFCSNYLATSKEGFDRDILFTNEESPDYVLRQEDSWPPAIGDPAEEENGVVLAVDVKTGEYHTVYGMGRHNHENDVAIPGFDDLVVLSRACPHLQPELQRCPDRCRLSRSSTRTSHRARTTCSPTRATSGHSFRTRRASRTTTTSPQSRGHPSRGTSSRCRRTSPRDAMLTARS